MYSRIIDTKHAKVLINKVINHCNGIWCWHRNFFTCIALLILCVVCNLIACNYLLINFVSLWIIRFLWIRFFSFVGNINNTQTAFVCMVNRRRQQHSVAITSFVCFHSAVYSCVEKKTRCSNNWMKNDLANC